MISNYYKYDEFRYADLIYRSGFRTKHRYTELCLLVKYYRDVLGVKPKDIKNKLKEFCHNHIKEYDYVDNYRTINKAIRCSDKSPLISVPFINIYEGELSYINSLDIPYEYKKLLFTYMAYIKLDNYYKELKYKKEYNNIIFCTNSQRNNRIRDMANLGQDFKITTIAIPYLSEKKLVKVLHLGKIVLEFLKNCKETGEIVITISDYDNIGWYYDYYHGKKQVILCKECKQPFRRNSNKQHYCKRCANTIHKKKALEHHYNGVSKM